MNHTTQKLRMTRKITITLCTLLSIGIQQFVQAMEPAPKAAESFKITTPEKTLENQQNAVQKAVELKKMADTQKANIKNNNKQVGFVDRTYSQESAPIKNDDGTTTNAYYVDGGFQMETAHPDGSKITATINATGDVKVKTTDKDASKHSDANRTTAEGSYKSDGTFDLSIKNSNYSSDLESHSVTGDNTKITKTTRDPKNNTVTTTISNAQGKVESIEVVDNNKTPITTTTTTFDLTTSNKQTVNEVSTTKKITTTYDPATKKPLTEVTIDKTNFSTTTIEFQPNGTKNLTLKEADGTVTKATVGIDGKETTTSVIKSTSRIVDERQVQAESVKGDKNKAESLVKDIAKDKGITLTEDQINIEAENFLSSTKSSFFSLADFIDSLTRMFNMSSGPTNAQIKSKTALNNTTGYVDSIKELSPGNVDLFATPSGAA